MVRRKYTKLAVCSAVIRRVAQKPKWWPYCFWEKLNLSGYHADTPITIKAEPFIWPTAALINIHEHPI